MTGRASERIPLLVLLFSAALIAGCAAPRATTALKELEPVQFQNSLSITVACIRDKSEEKISGGLFSPTKVTINLSEPAELKLGSLLQDSGSFSKVRVIPHAEIPESATELTCISMARKERTNLVIHGEVSHRASFSLNWLTGPSWIPGAALFMPLWAPNYNLKGEVELTMHVVDVNSLERIFFRKVTEEAYTSVCFLTRVTALPDRYANLEKNIALHNAAAEASALLLKTLASYEPGKPHDPSMSQGKVLAVADFQPGSDFIKRMGYGDAAAEKFTTAFQKSGVFEVIERQRIKDVLAERQFSMTDLVQPEKASQVAKLLGIDYLLVGSVSKVGARLEISVRLLDISNGEVLLSESDGITRYEDMQILAELMARRVIERFSKLEPQPEK
jgi:TolB-like protein